MLVLLLTAAAYAQDAATAAADYMGPAGGLLGGGVATAFVVERLLRKGDTATEDLADIKATVKELHEWHAKEDEDGVKVWYVRKSLADAIGSLSEAVVAFQQSQERQTFALEHIAELMNRLDRRIPADKD